MDMSNSMGAVCEQGVGEGEQRGKNWDNCNTVNNKMYIYLKNMNRYAFLISFNIVYSLYKFLRIKTVIKDIEEAKL